MVIASIHASNLIVFVRKGLSFRVMYQGIGKKDLQRGKQFTQPGLSLSISASFRTNDFVQIVHFGMSSDKMNV